MSRAKLTSKLTVTQAEIAAQFADYSFDYPTMSFDEVARKVLGSKPFPNTRSGQKFRTEAKAVFDQERK
jgi:glycine cleavage system protein P-like pyridoxal-binding family